MSLSEVIILCLTIYVVIGTLSTIGAAMADAGWKGVAFAFFCWPRIAWYGLLMLIERGKT